MVLAAHCICSPLELFGLEHEPIAKLDPIVGLALRSDPDYKGCSKTKPGVEPALELGWVVEHATVVAVVVIVAGTEDLPKGLELHSELGGLCMPTLLLLAKVLVAVLLEVFMQEFVTE